EGGALGIGGGGMGGLMTGRASANLLTRATAVLAALFMITSLGLTILASEARRPQSILEEVETPAPLAPAAEDVEPAAPDVPIAE
ncbi:MAG: preprotein translocase subunit SecG, partial [Alphaproteobacteria bacterium]